MPGTTSRRAPGAEPDRGAEPRPLFELSAEQETELTALALATLQESQPTWRKADLIRCLGELLPDDTICRDDQSAATLLERLADRVLAGKAGAQVLALEAPEHPKVPQALRRADGRSVYQPHGATRYATLAQLSLEDRLTALARQQGAPSLQPAQAAQLLGAEQRNWQRNSAQTQTRTRPSTPPAPACASTRPPRRSRYWPATAAPTSSSARPAPARPAPPRPPRCSGSEPVSATSTA